MNKYKKVVLKIGSALISNEKNTEGYLINNICDQISTLSKNSVEFVIVTSGAISQGQKTLKITHKPEELDSLQALAAIGQQSLMRMYEESFNSHNIKIAQVLLTHDDMNEPSRYLNAKATIKKILELNVIPIINENDVVATEEIRFGDNDNLAAMVSNLIQADLMIILTNQEGFFDKNPDTHNNASLIKKCDIREINIDEYDDSKSEHGTGGFKTKLQAVKIAAKSNTDTVIASGYEQDVLIKILDNVAIGTFFASHE